MSRRRTEPVTEFGKILRALMDHSGYATNSDLARVSGIDPSALGKWADGVGQPTLDSLKKIAPHLKTPEGKPITLAYLLVAAGMCTYEELGANTISPRPLHPTLAKLDRILSDSNIPTAAKDALVRATEGGYQLWVDMMGLRAPKEPAAAKRSSKASR